MVIAGTRSCGCGGALPVRARYCTRLGQRSVDKTPERNITARKGRAILASVRIRHRFPSSDRELPRRTALSPTPPIPDASAQLPWPRASRPQPQWLPVEAIEPTQTGPNRITVRSAQGSCRSRSSAILSNQTATVAAEQRVSATARQPCARSKDTPGHCKRCSLTVQVSQHRFHQPRFREPPCSQDPWLAIDFRHPDPVDGQGIPCFGLFRFTNPINDLILPSRRGGGHRLSYEPRSTRTIAWWGVIPVCGHHESPFGSAGVAGDMVPTCAGKSPALISTAFRLSCPRW
jgi:hypothetical protein